MDRGNFLAMFHNVIDCGFQVKPALLQNKHLGCQNMVNLHELLCCVSWYVWVVICNALATHESQCMAASYN